MSAPFPEPTGDASPEEADGLPTPRRHFAAAVILMAIGVSVIDGSIVNVALPTISRELGIAPGDAIWIVNAYQLAITVSLLPVAALGERLGYRRVYLAGLAIFTLASLACAVSQTLPQLLAARVLQGLGAGGLMAIHAAMVRFTYPAHQLGRGIARNAMAVSICGALGPSIGSAILSVASWPWLFAVNVPLGLLTIAVGLKALPPAPGRGTPFDVLSALMNAVAFGALILGAESLARGAAGLGGAELMIGVAAAALLVRREAPKAAPLMPIDLLRIRLFRLSILTSIAAFTAYMLVIVALPFHFQTVMGRSVLQTGVLLAWWPLTLAAAAPIAGRLADRYPVGVLGGTGLAVFAVGLCLLAAMPADAADPDVIWRMVVCGVGFGLFQSPNNRAIVASAPRERSGAAGGMLATGRLLGQTTGAVAMALLFHTGLEGPTVMAMGIAAVASAGAGVLSLLRLRPGSDR